ncbi:MAG: cell division protein FtsZ [Chloroflexi bacterium]|nr:cell division protein FtsZ [Chloroflexota bacterium]
MPIRSDSENFALIRVVGVGGGGNNAVNRMIRSEMMGVEFIGVNTDAQALLQSDAPHKIRIGDKITRGLGAGGDASIGQRAAEEDAEKLEEALRDSDMVFITAGLGGGTGSGAAPVIAEISKGLGALTIGVVTKPFGFEGAKRKMIAEKSADLLRQKVDTLIVIPNDRLKDVVTKNTTILDAFKVVDDILRQGVQGISDIITMPGLINLDFADVRTIMKDAGTALMGIGRASGESRAVDAARQAISSPLLEVSITGAQGILFNVCGSANLGLFEVTEAAEEIRSAADPEANIIFGTSFDERLGDEVTITVIATGFDQVRRREAVRQAPAGAAETSAAGSSARGDRDRTFLDELERQRTIGEAEEAAAAATTAEVVHTPAPSPKSTSVRSSDGPSVRRSYDAEDLEIPAFLRRKS